MKTILPIIGAAVVALIIGGAGAWFLKPEPAAEVVAAPPIDNEQHGAEHLEQFVIRERILTLADPGAKRYLKVSMALMWKDLTATPTAKADGESDFVFIAYVEDDATDAVGTAPSGPKGPVLGNQMEVADIVTVVISAKRVDEISSTDGKERLREELKGKINAILPKTQQIAKVLFTDFVIQ